MSQLHRRFTDQEVAFLLQAYSRRLLSRREIQERLGIGKTRFFELWKMYQADPEAFSISYERPSPGRISLEAEAAIERELLREKELIEDDELPITSYNYSALRDRLLKQGITVSVNTIIDRGRKLGCHKPGRKHKAHDREVLTSSIEALVQQDASTHRWSPFASEKWTLITAIDDYSRLLLFADFFSAETTWAHIQATRAVVETFGVPLRCYVDSLRVFRFVQGRDSVWRNHVPRPARPGRAADGRRRYPVGQDDEPAGRRRHLRALTPGQGQGRKTLPLDSGPSGAHLRTGGDH
jgi:hypothetical protein